MRLTGSVVQPMSCYDLLSYKAIGSNYLSFVVTSMLVSTSPLDEAGTATHFPLSESSGRKGPANVVSSVDHPITSGSPVWQVKRERAPIAVNWLDCAALWHVRRERAPIAVNRLDCAALCEQA